MIVCHLFLPKTYVPAEDARAVSSNVMYGRTKPNPVACQYVALHFVERLHERRNP